MESPPNGGLFCTGMDPPVWWPEKIRLRIYKKWPRLDSTFYILKDGYWIKVAPKMPFFYLSINGKKRAQTFNFRWNELLGIGFITRKEWPFFWGGKGGIHAPDVFRIIGPNEHWIRLEDGNFKFRLPFFVGTPHCRPIFREILLWLLVLVTV